jgi:hypothetical protein
MIVGVAAEVLIEAHRQHTGKRSHGTTVAQLARLLHEHQFVIGDRHSARVKLGLIRHHRRTPAGQFRHGWHWLVICDDKIHDPGLNEPQDAAAWLTSHDRDKIIYYAVARSGDDHA